MKYRVIHTPSGEEVTPGDGIGQFGETVIFKSVTRGPDQCTRPGQSPKVLVDYGFKAHGEPFLVERYAHSLQLEVLEDRRQRFAVTVTRGPENEQPFTVGDFEFMAAAAWPYSIKDGSLKFDFEELV